MASPGTGDSGVVYFAYGSNLSTTQMSKRCPTSKPIGLALLPDWKWLINQRGYANIVPFKSSMSAVTDIPSKKPDMHPEEKKAIGHLGVYGVLYRLDPSDGKTLDRFEGVPWAYQKQLLDVFVVPPPKATSAAADKGKVSFSEPQPEMEMVQALVYVDSERTRPAEPLTEYIARMNSGIKEAMAEWHLPEDYVNNVLRLYIPAPDGEK
ncbi:hypothetical protein GGR54DRAFT_615413 [Hypoxylon sp. NC1633]|nr:hypothetical protein GGR54DRAFT_615413 [Hypoxylon sp. NC1633]